MKKMTHGKDIAGFLKKPLVGPSRRIAGVADLLECSSKDMVWVKAYSEERLAALEERQPALVICDNRTGNLTSVPHILSDRPRLDFILALKNFFKTEARRGIHPTAIIGKTTVLGESVFVGPYAEIGDEAVLGDHCHVGSGVRIEGRVRIGRDCYIKSNSVIGGQGFGFEFSQRGRLVHFPHVGDIAIGDNVWIGACTTIERGTLGTTRLADGCKIDDLVQVGHNVRVGEDSMVMANSVICGGAIIGRRCWIAPNSVIKEKVRIGDRVTVGLGAVVLRDVSEGLTVAGVPARPLRRKRTVRG
jgi:UDP-3-O-[3-hydroxymyristoyl] glucosamine N-acyltransferase